VARASITDQAALRVNIAVATALSLYENNNAEIPCPIAAEPLAGFDRLARRAFARR
jgi:hypothetical protein